jgi:uncharacterized protein (TIGR01244 family)
MIKINDRLTIGPQPPLASFASLAAAGYTVLINNRPDFEDPTQPGSAAEQAAAEAAGLGYAHLPVSGATLNEALVRDFQAVLAESPGPVFAHCKSGMRTLMLYAIGEALDGRMAGSDIVAFGADYGFDLTAGAMWVARHQG